MGIGEGAQTPQQSFSGPNTEETVSGMALHTIKLLLKCSLYSPGDGTYPKKGTGVLDGFSKT